MKLRAMQMVSVMAIPFIAVSLSSCKTTDAGVSQQNGRQKLLSVYSKCVMDRAASRVLFPRSVRNQATDAKIDREVWQAMKRCSPHLSRYAGIVLHEAKVRYGWKSVDKSVSTTVVETVRRRVYEAHRKSIKTMLVDALSKSEG